MHAAHYPEVPDDFGNWLAGFIDGEGCFAICRQARGNYSCQFIIALRADDGEILREIAERTGIGRVHVYRHWASLRRAGHNPQAHWVVANKSDCRRLVALLDAHPLRAKKARDYALWREAVAFWTSLPPIRSYGRQGTEPHGWGPMADLHQRLKDVRAYNPPPPRPQPEPPGRLWED